MFGKRILRGSLYGALLCAYVVSTVFLSSTTLRVAASSNCGIENGVPQCENGANFSVNIPGTLTLSITSPSQWAHGDAGDLIRNVIEIGVVSNTPNGFTLLMSSGSDNPALVNVRNEEYTIPMLTGDWTQMNGGTQSFWGYSTDDENLTGTYRPIALKSETPTTILSTQSLGVLEQKVYFGARISSDTPSGTYTGRVIISVVSGFVED